MQLPQMWALRLSGAPWRVCSGAPQGEGHHGVEQLDLSPDRKEGDRTPGIPAEPPGAGSAEVLATHPLESVRARARVLPRDAGTRRSAASALLQQSKSRARASEPHILEAAAGEGTHQVPCMGCLLSEPLSSECLLYARHQALVNS